MWDSTPSANELRNQFPEIALELDTALIIYELQRLGLRYQRKRRAKSVLIEILMSPHHLMRISPVDVAAHGYAEWTTWFWNQTHADHPAQLCSSIRAHIEIIDLKAKDPIGSISFTSHQDDIESLIRNGMAVVRSLGLKIVPLITHRRLKAS